MSDHDLRSGTHLHGAGRPPSPGSRHEVVDPTSGATVLTDVDPHDPVLREEVSGPVAHSGLGREGAELGIEESLDVKYTAITRT